MALVEAAALAAERQHKGQHQRSAGWKLADLAQLDTDKSYYLEFSYKLDTTQLPSPMQFGLGGLGGQGDWSVGASRVLKLDLSAPP